MSARYFVFSKRNLLVSGLAFGLACAAAGQTTATQMAVMNFTFRDSATAVIVKPDAVLIDNKVVYNIIDQAGRMIVPATPGDHRVVIKANGYADLDSRQTASLTESPMNLLMLDPLKQPTELLPENLSKGMPADGTVIVGYVTDQTMGAPLKGATVELLDHDVKVQTNEDGFFKLPVHMPDGKPIPDDPRGVLFTTRNFRVTQPGYGYEERLNVLLETGAPKIYQVLMIRGGGGESLDEANSRNNLQSGLFGLTNVEPDDPPTTGTSPQHEGHSH